MQNDCNESTATPIKIPNRDLPKCSLLCSLEFLYPSTPWKLHVVSKDNKYMKFVVDNDEPLSRMDIKYNGNGYQLHSIEFFLPSIHQLHCTGSGGAREGAAPAEEGREEEDEAEGSCSPRYDVEMVMSHKALSWKPERQKWLNISVFVTPMYTYSISQDFFEQIIQPLRKTCTASSQACVQRVGGVDIGDYPLQMKSKWSPYQAIPHRKSFYIYKGDFPYAPCRANANDDIVWVVMENTVPMHFNEYDALRNLQRKGKTKRMAFPYNDGQNYTPKPRNNRAVYYNDGSFVQGSSRDKFYVKCVKKEQHQAQKILSFRNGGDQDDVSSASEAYAKRRNMYTFYQPVDSFISSVTLSMLFTLITIAIFYYASKPSGGASGEGGDGEGEGGEGGGSGSGEVTSARVLFLALMAFAYVFLHAMTFVNGWLMHSQSLVTMIVAPLVIMFGGWAQQKSADVAGPLGTVIKIVGIILIAAGAMQLANSVVLMPLTSMYNMGVQSVYDYYYVENESSDEPADWAFYIGYRVGVSVMFNNIQRNYRTGDSGDASAPVSEMRGKFMKITLSEPNELPTSLVATDAATKKKRMIDILKLYDSRMKRDNRNPLENFVQAAWTVLKADYNGQDIDSMRAAFKEEVPSLILYLDTDSIAN